eukprot:jgi/Botrbrau1/19458/Bobra.0338s0078.1
MECRAANCVVFLSRFEQPRQVRRSSHVRQSTESDRARSSEEATSSNPPGQPRKAEVPRPQRFGSGRPRRRIVVDDKPYVDVEASPSDISARAPRAPPGTSQQTDLLKDLSVEELESKSAALLKILTAGAQVEQAIRQNRKDIDMAMVTLLERRIRSAARTGERPDMVKGMMLLQQRLKREAERQAASPAQRVLDDALRILDPSSPTPRPQKEELVQERLESAFRGRGDAWDIFGAAALLAQGEEVAEEIEEEDDLVLKEHFLEETQRLLSLAEAQYKQIQSARGGGKHAEEVAAFLQERQILIVHLQDILAIAKSIRA